MTRVVRMAMLAAAIALMAPATVTAQYGSEVVGFNGPPIDDPATSQEMVRQPGFSGSTSGFIIPNPTGSYEENSAFRASGLAVGQAALRVFFKWVDETDDQAWLRLSTFDGPERPNPALHTQGTVTFEIANQAELFDGNLGLCLGIRETGALVPQLADGGTSGDIEWVGVDTTPNGIVVGEDGIVDTTAAGDDVQVYDVGTDLAALELPLGTAVIAVGDNGVLDTTPADDDEVRFGYFINDDGGRTPIPALVLPPSPSFKTVEFNLATGEVKLNGSSQGGGIAGFTGNGLMDVDPPRGTLEHFAFTNDPDDPATDMNLAIDELQFDAPDPDPVVPPRVVAPIIADDVEVTVTDLLATVDQVSLYVDGELLATEDVVTPDDVVFSISPAVADEVYTATQRDSVTGFTSEQSPGVTVLPEASPYSFSVVLDEDGNNCSPAGPWEFVPVTAVDSTTAGPAPRGMNMFNMDGIWQTVEIPLDDSSLVLPWLGGSGEIEPAGTGIFSIDTFWFTMAEGAESTGRTKC
jgi:hypothetical protein